MQIHKTLTVSGIMIATMILLSRAGLSEKRPPHKPFSTFPVQIGQWHGTMDRFDEKVYKVLGVDDSILAHYKTTDQKSVHLYIGFYQSQKEGDLIHSPKNCLPGSGWNITATSVTDLAIPEADQGKQKAIKLILQKGLKKQIMLYWFQSRGRIITSEYKQKIYLVLDSITRRRTDGSFVRLVSPVVNNNEKKTLELMESFTRELYPILKNYIPS